jgi:hypothetical protein
MSKSPRLKVKVFGYPGEDIFDLEQAVYRFSYTPEVAYIVDGQAVASHEELVKVAAKNKGKEFLDVVIISDLVSGG